MARVTLEGIHKSYGDGVKAVDGVDLAVGDEEFMVLVGPSGCGKSTTLRMIAGLESVTAGDIAIDGARVNDMPPKDRDIAMVFQNYALYPHMTVHKNLGFGLKLRGYPRREIDARVREAAGILGITDLLQRRPKALSGGERQRVAVGRAIVRHPKVFLFDEPLSNLDAKLRVQMRAEISKLHTKLGATMIYVTHDQVEAMTMGDRIAVMRNGKIQQVDAPLAVYQRPANRFVAEFIGSPPMNMLDGLLVAENGDMQFRAPENDLVLSVPPARRDALTPHLGKPITLGVRPEHLGDNPAQSPVAGRSIEARVEVVEPMGAEIYLNLRIGAAPLVARIQADVEPEVNAPRLFDVDMERAHFFDGATEAAIR